VHSKMMIIDGRRLVCGSKNMDGDTCMEFMAVLEGTVAMATRQDFQLVWSAPKRGGGWEIPLPEGLTNPITTCQDGDVPILLFGRREYHADLRLGGITEPARAPQDIAWHMAMALAEQEVYIQTPNFTTEQIFQDVFNAVRRGIRVTIVESYRSGDTNAKIQTKSMGSNGETARKLLAKLAMEPPEVRNRLKLCWFIGKRVGANARPNPKEWSHVKMMIIDNKITMFGSGNQDPQSWYHSRENNYMIDDAATTQRIYANIMEKQQSLEACYNYL